MDAAARRRILGDLGIVPWQLRAAPGDGAAGAARPEPEGRRAPVPVTPAGPGTIREPAGTPAAAAAAPGAAPAARPAANTGSRDQPPPSARPAQEPPRPAADTKPAEPFSVLALVSGDTLMLVDGAASRRDQRLARDVLAAASGDFAGRPASRTFRWPPVEGGIDLQRGAEAAVRALAAFVDKDVADHAVRRVLCTPEVAARWSAAPGGAGRIELPPLADLGQDPAAKRALWQRLRNDA
ncbi:MAG: hypothetical protein CMQ43_05105 [Gammaproteobacteria bacterium]|nr:hypothetical protein [Gammaproteobacteria bacterium]